MGSGCFCILLVLLLNGCGNDKTTSPEAPEMQVTGPNHAPLDSETNVELNSQVHIEEESYWEVLGGRVYAERQWQFSSYAEIDGALEITGQYVIAFRNETDKRIKVSAMRLVFENDEGSQVAERRLWGEEVILGVGRRREHDGKFIFFIDDLATANSIHHMIIEASFVEHLF
ncbi:MAG: hypothetical protein HOC74_15910 [Gemmatimonadetes bacterium]|jgi:hypothetical protein|nr:hypothetical protein [Gemmatimonadota bacterium]